MGILVRDGSVWKDSEPYVKDSGIWKPVDTGYVKDAGVWKETYSSGWVLEGSWEEGWEGWVTTSSPYIPSRVQNYNRTGLWGVGLNPGPGGLYTLEYTVPSQMATEFMRCSVWFTGFFARKIRARIGSGAWFDVAEVTPASAWAIAEGLVHNPLLQAVTFQVLAEGGASGNGCDDWKIESLSVPPIGGAFEGGFYAGNMKVGGVNYMHILADVADAASLEWGGYDPVLVTNARSETDSKANTDILVNHSRTYAAAEYCRNYRGGGFDDWDLPAVQVLEMCGANFASGPQAVTGNYWSSTEASSGNAIRVAFPQFQRGNHTKGAVYIARPVRRIRIANL